ncbi:MAG: DUF5906 domain-containing protein [Microbacteriaceae bacterium]
MTQFTYTTLLDFLAFAPEDLTLVRVFKGEGGIGTTDVACSSDVDALIKSAYREPWLSLEGMVSYVGCYLRLCHKVDPVDWLGSNPKLTESTAQRYPAFVVDIDPPKEGNATQAELDLAWACAAEIEEWQRAVLGDDLSYSLDMMSGNGVQRVLRCAIDLDDRWLAGELLQRMQQRWPLIDPSGWKPTVGPAMPGTLKAKAPHTDERPQRMVEITRYTAGERVLGQADLQALVDSLPPVEFPVSKRLNYTTAYSEIDAIHQLPIEDALISTFGEVLCPSCKRMDGSVAVVSENILACQHRNSCPAAREGKTGWTAYHAIGMCLFDKWRYSDEERSAIVEYARERWDLVWQQEGFEPDRVQAINTALAQHPLFCRASALSALFSRHKSVVPKERWILNSKSARIVAGHVRDALVEAYAPDYVAYTKPHPLVHDGTMQVYHQDLGVWVPAMINLEDPDGGELGRMTRILLDQENAFGISAATGKGIAPWSPPTEGTMREMERLCSIQGFFTNANVPVGIAAIDGFVELRDGKWKAIPHSPRNRARGAVGMSASDVIEGRGAKAAKTALRAVLRKLLSEKSEKYIDDLLRAYLEQVGGTLCRMRSELRQGFIFTGANDTGKSVMIEITERMFARVGLKVATATIADINSDFPPESLLDCAAILHTEETAFDSGKQVSLKKCKNAVEGSPFNFNRKNRPAISARIRALHMAATNHQIELSAVSGEASKRYYCVQFPLVETPEEKRDYGLKHNFLRLHLDGLIVACVHEAQNLAKHGRTSLAADSELREESKALGRVRTMVEDWLLEDSSVATCEPLAKIALLRDSAYKKCMAWTHKNGYPWAPLTHTKFTRELTRLGVGHRYSSGRNIVGLYERDAEVQPSDEVQAAAGKALSHLKIVP